MAESDVRWAQRFNNFRRALTQLTRFLAVSELTELERQGLIKSFEYTFELAWNVIKDFYEAQGEIGLQGSRDAFRLAFKRGLITEGEVWMRMIQSRIQTAHTYNEETAALVERAVRNEYYPLFQKLSGSLNAEAGLTE